MPLDADSTLPKDPEALLTVIAALRGELAEERAARRAVELGLQAKALEAERLRVQIARQRHGVLVSKYCDHVPLYRQSEIYGREGLDLPHGLLAGWVGKSAALLEPVAEFIGRHVIAAERVHADDTPMPMLSPGRDRTLTGRFWAYPQRGTPRAEPRLRRVPVRTCRFLAVPCTVGGAGEARGREDLGR